MPLSLLQHCQGAPAELASHHCGHVHGEASGLTLLLNVRGCLQQYWSGAKEEYAFIPVRELAEAFTQTETYQHNMRELDAPYKPPADCSPELDPLMRSK